MTINQTETLRQDVDIGLAKFLSQEVAEEGKRSELSTLMEQVDILEAEVRPKLVMKRKI